MSPANVEIVRLLYETVARRDAAAVLDFYDPEDEWDMTRGPLAGFTASAVYRGHEGMQRFFRERFEAWEEIEDHCDELKMTNATLWTIRDGKIVRVVWFGSRDAALEAAGLSA
jgi:ketosteroid isomerase-like protein